MTGQALGLARLHRTLGSLDACMYKGEPCSVSNWLFCNDEYIVLLDVSVKQLGFKLSMVQRRKSLMCNSSGCKV